MLDRARPASSLDGVAMRSGRAAILNDRSLSGRSLTRRLADQADGWLISLAGRLVPGWSLAATGGYSRGQLYPQGDVDVVLLHPRTTSAADVDRFAQRVWYPFWDAGVKISPAAHSDRTLLQLARTELFTLTALLEMRHIAGDAGIVERIRDAALEIWRKQPRFWLDRLAAANHDRWRRSGDVASRLEPHLKDGRGGLRDVDALRWALASGCPDIASALDAPLDDVGVAAATIGSVRAELHRTAGRATDTLLLQDQDDVAAAAGYGDADEMMLTVSAAARQIEWVSTRFWARREHPVRLHSRVGRGHAGRHGELLADGIAKVDSQVELTESADLSEPSLTWRVAEVAARHGLPLARSALVQLANAPIDPTATWSTETRRSFLGLLGCGPALLDTAESLEYFGLLSRLIPEWTFVRSRPQRNAFHVYTVDRHLLQTVVEANHLLRTVSRPDLLLVAALFHDLGKGYPGDHTAAGVAAMPTIARRMGFTEDDVETLTVLIDTHLLLAETATRRDLDDPRTAELVAERVGSRQHLRLLRALTEADSLATGPSSWSPWKASLIDRLTDRVLGCFGSKPSAADRPAPPPLVNELLARSKGQLELAHEAGAEVDTIAVVSPDRTGLFATIAGTLACHGIEVISAELWTTDGGLAVDYFQVAKGTPVDVARLYDFLAGAAGGEIDVAERVARRLSSSARHRRALAAAPPRLEVSISNHESATTTMIEVRSPDSAAVLYRLASALHQHDLDVVNAKVATLGHEIVDVFYVRRVNHPNEPQLPDAEHQALSAALATAAGAR